MPNELRVDWMGAGNQLPAMVFGGSAGKRLLSAGMDHNVLKPWIGDDGRSYITRIVNGVAQAIPAPFINATLRKDEWKEMDDTILEVAQEELVGVQDLYSRNLVYRENNGLGKTVFEWEDVDDFSDAELTMDAVNKTIRDRPNYELRYMPLPIVHKDFAFNIRLLAASRAGRSRVDTTSARLAAGRVMNKVEDMLFNGTSSYTYGGGTIYGYTDYPSANTGTLTVAWTASAATGDTILADVRAMKQSSIAARHRGPWILYIPDEYETVLDDDFKAASDKSIRERILEIEGIQAIRVADKLANTKVVLVEMKESVVRMVEGMPLTTVEWEEGGGFTTNWKVMTIMVPQIRSDQEGYCGVTVYSAP